MPTPTSAPEAPAAVDASTPVAATPSLAPSPAAPPEIGQAAPRETRVVAGIPFALVAGPADLHLETTLSLRDARDLAEQVADDVRSVEHEFGMSFADRPRIYVFGTTASYAAGMARIFGYPTTTADWIAENSVAFFEPPLRIIGVNWEAIAERRPIAAIRHELTHLMTLRACGSRCDLVPAWLNEGQARLAEAYIPGADWRLLRVRFEAASMAMTGTLVPLRDLITQDAWNSLTSWAGYYKYQEAARAVELLREDIGGDAPIARLYERLRRGENVARAYATLTGRSFDDFVAGLEARIRAGVHDGPEMVTIPTTPEGSGASYLLYGFAPSATVDVTVTGKRETATARVVVSPFGAMFDSLAWDLPRGLYQISATDGQVTVTAAVVKR